MAGTAKHRQFGHIRRLPSGRWQASYVGPDGRRRVAAETFRVKADASSWLATVEADPVRGTWRAPERAVITVGEYANAWLARRGDLKRTTAALYRSHLDRRILPVLGEVQLGRLSAEHVTRWHATTAAGTGPTAAAQAYRLLHAVLAAAVEDGVIVTNPARIRGASTPTPAREARVLAPAEVAALATAAPDRYRALVLLLAWSGLRFGEAIALTRADIAEDGSQVTVRRRAYRLDDGRVDVDVPKSAAGRRTVHLPGFVAAELRQHLARYVGTAPSAAVFTTATGAPPARSNWTATLRRAAGRAGLDPIRSHWLRHAGAPMAAYTGATTAELQSRFGHSTTAAAAVYQHAVAERDRQLAERLDQLATASNVTPLRPAR